MNYKMLITRVFVLLIVLLFSCQFSYSQKWYYHSMHEKMAIADTSTNVLELNKCDEVFNRVLVSRPADSLALYYHFFVNCLKHFYQQTPITTEEQKKSDKSLRILDSIYVNKCEIQLLGMFNYLLAHDLNTDPTSQKEIFALINSVKNKCPNSPRIFFVETFALYKYKQINQEELTKLISVCNEKYGVYIQSKTLAPNWGRVQLNQLQKLSSK